MAAESETMKAVVLSAPGSLDALAVGDFPKPTAGAGQVLVKVKAASINPVDHKMAVNNFWIPRLPAVLGCDVSGVVEAVGEGVTAFAVGDEVFSWNDLQTGSGTWAEYVAIDEDLPVKKPESLSHAQTATLGISWGTAAEGLFGPEGGLGLPLSGHEGTSLLVWGGSTSVGVSVVQMAALAGFNVIATASERNHEYVKSLGAAAVVDYKAADALDQIKAAAGDKPLRIAFDTVGSASATMAASVLDTSVEGGAAIATIAGVPDSAPDGVKVQKVLLATATGSPSRRKWLHDTTESTFLPWLASGKFKPNNVRELAGLEGIIEGAVLSREGKLSAEKAVGVL